MKLGILSVEEDFLETHRLSVIKIVCHCVLHSRFGFLMCHSRCHLLDGSLYGCIVNCRQCRWRWSKKKRVACKSHATRKTV